jgi:hypothetical protein
MNETTFENARVGDAVWSLEFGWGILKAVKLNLGRLNVNFDNGEDETYLFTGQTYTELKQTLFWDEIPITAPPRPKRLVTKRIEVYVRISKDGNIRFVYDAGKIASEFSGNIINLSKDYEVEE